ncbi:AAA family ATPase, partial [Cupriavidus sp. 2MCAB6]|uniref:AAA family ATPase n=1 Tax=Cupriavidus sp. 2MCAB6 TaxID=3232981 RepID=UPI003F91698A
IAEALAVVSDKALLGKPVNGRRKVWLYNLEDPVEELWRRIEATALHYNLEPEDYVGRLFVNSGRDQELVIAEHDRHGAKICAPVVEDVVAALIENEIDVMIIDPFISSHRVPENDNPAIDLVVKTW